MLNSRDRIVRWVGRGVMLAGLVFVVRQLLEYHGKVSQGAEDPTLWLTVALFSLLYGISGVLLSSGWLRLLRAQSVGQTKLSWVDCWSLYGKTQIAKYVPGNFFHIAGRHMLAVRKGIPQLTLLTAATLEIVFVLISAGLLSLIAAGTILEVVDIPALFWGIVGLVVFCILSGCLLCRSPKFKQIVCGLRWRHLLVSITFYFMFFSASALLFFLIMVFAAESASVVVGQWYLVAGGYAFAWGVGFVVPGAPGGLGVREAILVVFLQSSFPAGLILLSSIAFRLVTTGGDVVFYLIALGIERVRGEGAS